MNEFWSNKLSKGIVTQGLYYQHPDSAESVMLFLYQLAPYWPPQSVKLVVSKQFNINATFYT